MKFVFDLDGTICFQGKPLSNQIVSILDTLMSEGHEIIFASARPIRDLLPVIPTHMHHFPLVGGNGGFVYQNSVHVSSFLLDKPLANQILNLLEKYEADYLIDSLWDYSYSGDPEHPIRRNLDPEKRAKNVLVQDLEEIVKVVVLSSRDQNNLQSELAQLPIKMYKHGTENIIDISPADINKWSGLRALGLQPSQYIAFGNDANDIPMFQYALRSVCVGDHAELKEIASESIANQEIEVIRKITEIIDELREVYMP